jgi:hypothetical protein
MGIKSTIHARIIKESHIKSNYTGQEIYGFSLNGNFAWNGKRVDVGNIHASH